MAVKTYSYYKDGNKLCSVHTTVKEMASKKGLKLYSDVVLIDTELLAMVEKLFSKLHCSKYIISSGYRTPEHDRAVGGNGYGQHTKGKAMDCCFYDKNGKVISAKIVCCVAQDLGFKGIANISKKYQYVHLDMRDSGVYRGDEIKGTNSVTSDFYNYFGISKADVSKYTGEAVPTAPKVNCWVKDNKGWYYLGADGNQVKNDWVLDGGYWYFIGQNGYMATNCWCTDSQGWCYVGADGRAVTNCWKQIDGRWYYFNGTMAVKGYQQINGKLFYFAEANCNGLKECQLIITNDNGEIKL
ncbi:MAG: hypothetical protein IJE01_01470 [Clostridia bacterium]|nr:hypothetical protein [Clostridia bacterium]